MIRTRSEILVQRPALDPTRVLLLEFTCFDIAGTAGSVCDLRWASELLDLGAARSALLARGLSAAEVDAVLVGGERVPVPVDVASGQD